MSEAKKLPKNFRGNFVNTHDDEGVDEVRIKLRPIERRSTAKKDVAQQSADAVADDPASTGWGRTADVTLCRKGVEIYKCGADGMERAVKALPYILDDYTDRDAFVAKALADDLLCHQPGCAEPATVVVRCAKRFSRHEGHDMGEPAEEQNRAFCKAHLNRGNFSPDDSDDNYQMVGNIDQDQGGTDEGGAIV